MVTAHEFGHQSQNAPAEGHRLVRAVRVARRWAIARITRRRGGMRRPEAVPLSLLALAVLSFVAMPLQNAISRHMEQEADWQALETTRDPDAVTGLFQSFRETSLGDPTRRCWAYVLLDTHPTLIDRIEMAEAWKARTPARRRCSGDR